MRVELNWRLFGSSQDKFAALYQTPPSFWRVRRNLRLLKALSRTESVRQ